MLPSILVQRRIKKLGEEKKKKQSRSHLILLEFCSKMRQI